MKYSTIEQYNFEIAFNTVFMNRVNTLCNVNFNNMVECLKYYLTLNKQMQKQVHSDHTGNVIDTQLNIKSYKYQTFSQKHLKEVTIVHYLQEKWSE